MSKAVTIAHLSDVHLGPPDGFTWRHWNAKRLLGFVNWHRQRRFVHDPAVVARLLADLHSQAPDHIAVTGDLVNIGLPREHAAALGWLQGIGAPSRVTVVPGNHDIYCDVGADPGVRRWQPYMASDAWGAGLIEGSNGFPFLRRVGRIAIIGVNSAVPTPPAIATGRVGEEQLARLGRLLEKLAHEAVFRLVLVHHPPLPGLADRRRGLTDAAALERVLRKAGVDLVVHGHNHRNMLHWLVAEGGARAPVVGVASGSAARVHKGEPLARYNLFRIDADGADWRIEVVGRGLAEPGGPVVELERRQLSAEARGSHAPAV